jgi:hypothetical protein
MQAVDPAVRILEAVGITCAFGVPGPRAQSAAARNPEGATCLRRGSPSSRPLRCGAWTPRHSERRAAIENSVKTHGLKFNLMVSADSEPKISFRHIEQRIEQNIKMNDQEKGPAR